MNPCSGFLAISCYVSDNSLFCGIVCLSADRDIQFKPMLIEKWPLIQAFALDGFGG